MYFKGQGKILDDVRMGVEKQCRIRLCANTPVQIAGAAALNGPQGFVKGIVEKLKQRRDYAYKRLNEIEGVSTTKPEGAFYIFPKIEDIGEGKRWKNDKDFYAENKEFITNLVAKFGKPILAEVWNERFFYFALKWDLNFVDNQDKAAALSTDQIDVENAKRYDITFVDEKGEKQYPLILHCSPSGALEREIYALLEKAYRDQMTGKSPMLPLWLSPTQVRLIPISDKFLDKVEALAQQIASHNIRVDIDDAASTLQKKIREAEQEWVPYIIVVGEKEIESGTLSVRDREQKGKQEALTVEQIIAKVSEKIAGKPFKPLPLPMYISKRPQFHG
jgi:threonyl-tRNA synthetase